MWTVLAGLRACDVELARRLRDLLEHEVGVEEDGVVLDPLPGLAEQVERAVAMNSTPISVTIRRQPLSSVAIASADRIS